MATPVLFSLQDAMAMPARNYVGHKTANAYLKRFREAATGPWVPEYNCYQATCHLDVAQDPDFDWRAYLAGRQLFTQLVISGGDSDPAGGVTNIGLAFYAEYDNNKRQARLDFRVRCSNGAIFRVHPEKHKEDHVLMWVPAGDGGEWMQVQAGDGGHRLIRPQHTRRSLREAMLRASGDSHVAEPWVLTPVFTDAANLFQTSVRDVRQVEDRRLRIVIAALRQTFQEAWGAFIGWVPTWLMAADPLTKIMDSAILQAVIGAASFVATVPPNKRNTAAAVIIAGNLPAAKAQDEIARHMVHAAVFSDEIVHRMFHEAVFSIWWLAVALAILWAIGVACGVALAVACGAFRPRVAHLADLRRRALTPNAQRPRRSTRRQGPGTPQASARTTARHRSGKRHNSVIDALDRRHCSNIRRKRRSRMISFDKRRRLWGSCLAATAAVALTRSSTSF
jgi:hypothetical protein